MLEEKTIRKYLKMIIKLKKDKTNIVLDQEIKTIKWVLGDKDGR